MEVNEKTLKEEETKDSVVNAANSEKTPQAGIDYLKSKDDMALEYFSNAISLDSTDSAAFYNRAQVYLNKKLFSNALEDCDQAISLKSNYVKAHHRRAKVLMQLKEYTRAMSDLELVLQHEPGNTEANVEFLKSREEAGKTCGSRRINIIAADEAEDQKDNEEEDIATEKVSKDSESPDNSIAVFKEIADFEDFLKRLEEVKKSGNDYFRAEDFDQAITEFSKAIQCVENHYTEEQTLLEPSLLAVTVALLNNRALCFSKLDCNNEAIQDCLRVLRLDHNNTKALYRIGRCEASRNNFKEASRRMKQVIEITPDSLAAQKDYEEYTNKLAESIDAEKLPLTPRRKSRGNSGEEVKQTFVFESEKPLERRVSFRSEDFAEIAGLEKQTSKIYKDINSKFPKGKLEMHEEEEDDQGEDEIEAFTEVESGGFTLKINTEEEKTHKGHAVHISKEIISNAKEIASRLVSDFEAPKSVLMFETAAKALKNDLEKFYDYIRVRCM